jgi:hypothetical protein
MIQLTTERLIIRDPLPSDIDGWHRLLSDPKGTNGDSIDAIICTVDLMKKDSEIKILIGRSEDEKELVLDAHNNSEYMKGIYCGGRSIRSRIYRYGRIYGAEIMIERGDKLI